MWSDYAGRDEEAKPRLQAVSDDTLDTLPNPIRGDCLPLISSADDSGPSSRSAQIDAEQAKATIGNPIWRLSHLYKIRTKLGEVVNFTPNWVQEQLIHSIHVKKQRRHVVLKARKHGVSTLFELMILDWCYFGSNLQASIIDLTHLNASDKLTKIIKFAADNMPRELREATKSNSTKMLEFQNGSNINAGKNARGGVNQILHISEWGIIAHKDPKRSQEIKTGALPSADTGIHLIESTFYGGKGGDFYDLLKRSMETPEAEKTDKDYHFHFFAWQNDPRNVLDGHVNWVSSEVMKYLDEKEDQLKIEFSDRQRIWYFKTLAEQGIFMRREYPTTIEEAFSVPIEGSIYGDIISEIRGIGRIVPFMWDHGIPVFAAWDIGWDDTTVVWLFQTNGREIFWIHHVRARHRTAMQMVQLLIETGIPIGGHFLPHDAASNAASVGTSYKAEVLKTGAINVQVVPRTTNIWSGINALRDLLHRSWFRLPACAAGVEALEAYHTKDEDIAAVVTKEPVHDWSSHDCDAARIAAEALTLGMVRAPMKRILTEPRMPDGSMVVDLESARASTRRARSGLAITSEPL